MSAALVSVIKPQEATSLVVVHGQCEAIEAWAAASNSIPEIQDCVNRLAAIDEYLTLTSKQGRARVAAAMRRLEVHIGILLGPPPGAGPGRGKTSVAKDLSPDQRYQFRRMAEHRDIVETIIAESTDKTPATRSRVIRSLPRATEPTTPPKKQAAANRAQQIINLTDKGYAPRQIAVELNLSEHRVRALAKEHGITLVKSLDKTRHIDPNRIVNEAVNTLEALVMSTGLVEVDQLDRSQIDHWSTSLSNSLRSLNRLAKQLKEMAQ